MAIVGVDGEQSHALELISPIVKQATCQVIADIDGDHDSFLRKTARRGILAYVKHGEQPGMEHAIDIVLSRYAEFNRLHGALRTAAIIEQAKGILMEPHGITADQAFAELRSRARNTNKTVVDVAQAVTLSYPLFKFDRGPQAADLGRAVVLADDRFDRGDGPEPACAWATSRSQRLWRRGTDRVIAFASAGALAAL